MHFSSYFKSSDHCSIYFPRQRHRSRIQSAAVQAFLLLDKFKYTTCTLISAWGRLCCIHVKDNKSHLISTGSNTVILSEQGGLCETKFSDHIHHPHHAATQSWNFQFLLYLGRNCNEFYRNVTHFERFVSHDKISRYFDRFMV